MLIARNTFQQPLSKTEASLEANSTADRKIIHCDADCFFAAIEMRDDPSLKGMPMAVGGAADRRGVISTCNYEARAFGIRSAMATVTAKRLCPGLLVMPHRMDKYKEAAEQIREVFYEYTDLVEPLSLDEAFLDVSDSDNCLGSATLMAREIRKKVLDRVGITVSAGVAPNKFLAKVGSDWNKPDGLCVISPEQVDPFVRELPVDRLYGVGKVTAAKLHCMGINDCGDLRAFSVFQLSEWFGSFGPRLHELSHGIDLRPVKTSRRRKSLSVEHTYAADLPSEGGCLEQLPELYQRLGQRLSTVDGSYRVGKQFVKIKFSNFQTTTMECEAISQPRLAVFRNLLQQAVVRGGGLPVRLLGVGVRFKDCLAGQPVQLALFE